MSRNLKRVSQFAADSNGAISEGQLRWWIHCAEDNGMAKAGVIVRIGRAVYLDVDAFDRWLTEQNRRAA